MRVHILPACPHNALCVLLAQATKTATQPLLAQTAVLAHMQLLGLLVRVPSVPQARLTWTRPLQPPAAIALLDITVPQALWGLACRALLDRPTSMATQPRAALSALLAPMFHLLPQVLARRLCVQTALLTTTTMHPPLVWLALLAPMWPPTVLVCALSVLLDMPIWTTRQPLLARPAQRAHTLLATPLSALFVLLAQQTLIFCPIRFAMPAMA